jgi:hypothetical protein
MQLNLLLLLPTSNECEEIFLTVIQVIEIEKSSYVQPFIKLCLRQQTIETMNIKLQQL